MKKFLTSTVTAVTLLLVCLPSFALSLDQAKAQGLVGEASTGYLATIATAPNAKVQSLVTEINRKRKAAYKDKARKAGVALKVMETRIAERLQQRAAPGHYIQATNGQWEKK